MPQLSYKRLRIVKIPAGEAPLNIREAWVGHTFRGVGPIEAGRAGVISKEYAGTFMCYCIEKGDAIRLLDEQGEKEAARWWREEHSAPESEPLLFLEEECEEVPLD